MVYLNSNGAWEPTPIWNAYSGDALSGGDGCFISDEGGGRCGIPCKESVGSAEQTFNEASNMDAKECASTGVVTLDGDNSGNVDASLCAQRCYVKEACNYFTVLSSTSDGAGECKGFSTCEVLDQVACSSSHCYTRTV